MNQKSKDPLRKLKLLAYDRIIGPVEGQYDFKRFLTFAKMYLCVETGRLFKDPIWDEYSDEELLIEYFAHIFVKDKERRQEFESEEQIVDSEYDDFLKFADRMIEKNKDELAQLAEESPDSISFNPSTLGDDE